MNVIKMEGKLIVIEGIDGTGKKTQSNLLIKHLNEEGYKTAYFDFPRYDNPSSWAIKEFLNGNLGELNQLNPKIISILFAFDRFCASNEIKEALNQGKIAIANRYTTSNMGHQAAQIKNKEEKEKFLEWLENLEYKVYNLPKPNKVILLYMNPDIAQQLIEKREIEGKETKGNKGKSRDLLERNKEHLVAAQETYLYVAKKYKWNIVNCSPNGKLRSQNEIHQEILRIVKEFI
ncbi:MAG: dTMP kinase [Candidatus Woesearchaeota archaeon]|nr:dTMP kinase [Candidatus Woesearchaeota archaeon]